MDWFLTELLCVFALLAGWMIGALMSMRRWKDARRNPPPAHTKVIISYGIYVTMGHIDENGKWYDMVDLEHALPPGLVHSWQYAPPSRNYVDYDEVLRHGFF